jgi:hypothetical protein
VWSRGSLLNFPVQSGWGQEYTQGSSFSRVSLIADTGRLGMEWSLSFCCKLLSVTLMDVPCVDGRRAETGRGPPLLTHTIASFILAALAASLLSSDGTS